MPDRRRIVHLITRLELGGAQQNTLYCAAHHDRTRFDVELWAGAGGILDDEARAIPDATFRSLPWLKHPIRPAADLLAVFRLARLLRRARIDLLHTHSSKAGILGRLAGALARVPAVVHTVHGWSFNDTQGAAVRRFYVTLERAAAKRTDRLVFVSEADRREGEALGIGDASRYVVLRSGIERDAFVPAPGARERARSALGYADSEIVVGTLACLKAQKAPLDFVGAAAVAGARDPRLRFFVAGDGELRAEVEAAIAAGGLEGTVRLLGWRRDAADVLAAMDVFLLTSRFEGLPRAVLQAMAAGVPVVATAVGGTPEVVDDGRTGRLVPAGDPEAAGEAVAALAADPGLRHRLAGEAAARLGEEFDIRGMVRRLDRLYGDLLAPGK